MRVVKGAFATLIVAVLAVMWSQREPVLAAYGNEGRSSAGIQLNGVDLDFELSSIPPSPYQTLAAPDTKRAPVALAFFPETTTTTADAGDELGVDGVPEGFDGFSGLAPTSTTVPFTVPVSTVPPPPLYGGRASLAGTVTGPEGPVPWATVRIERHTIEGSITQDVRTDDDGRWRQDRLLGGRYRVRAWAVADDLTMTESQVFFLNEGDERPTPLALASVNTTDRVTLTDGGSIYLGLTGSIAFAITTESVDGDGRVVHSGVSGRTVSLTVSSGVTATPSVSVTGHDGVARFTLRCNELVSSVGQFRYTARQPRSSRPAAVEEAATGQGDGTALRVFALPACIPIPPPPTTQPEPAIDPATGLPVDGGAVDPGGQSPTPTTVQPQTAPTTGSSNG